LFVIVLVAAACGGSSDQAVTASIPDQGDSPASGTTDPTAGADRPSGALPAADATPSVPQLQFTAATVSGTELVGTDYAGTDTVFWFWAPW
jgi:hypothetical protein